MARSRAAPSWIADPKRLAWSCLAGDELLQSPPCLCANVCGAVSVLVSDEGSVTRGVVDELGDECDVVTGHRSAFIAAAAGAGPPWEPPFARKGAATLLLLARPPGDAWVVDHELVLVELDLGGEAPGPEADQPVA